MAYFYDYIDGNRVEANVANAYKLMANAFKNDTGYELRINSGTRTHNEQIGLFLARYRAQATGTGPFNDVRWWNGTRYVRHSNQGTVAVPGTSNHEEFGPNGPRSIDIRDTGPDAGVMTRNTARDKWMQRRAGEFGFENEGYNFGEPWHKTYRGPIGGNPNPPAIREENPNMYVVRSHKGHVYTLGQQYIRHELDGATAQFVANVVSADDKIIPCKEIEFLALLDAFGIPRDKPDAVLGGKRWSAVEESATAKVTDAQIKAVADAVATKLSGGGIKVNTAEIANAVRTEFSKNPLK